MLTTWMLIFFITQITRERTLEAKEQKKVESAPKQNNLNDKNAKRYFRWLVHSNFVRNDYYVTLTYNNRSLPSTVEEAKKQAKNYLRRIAHKRKKDGLDTLKYILITESKAKDGKPTRIHHHILINSGLDRDALEDLWRKRRKKGQKR